MNILIASISLGGLGIAFSVILFFAFKQFHVEVDPKEALILGVLPGTNCGACGFAGCQGLAEAITHGKAEANGCIAGGTDTAKKVAEVLGIKIDENEIQTKIAFVACRAGITQAKKNFKYNGLDHCEGASILFTGDKACIYGCLGLGSCVKVCPFDAIKINKDGLAVIDPKKCKFCKKCIKVCPRQIIKEVPRTQNILVACNNKDKGKRAKEVCSMACIACKICEKNCPEKAIVVTDNLAVIDYDKCKMHAICFEKCPQKSIIKI